MLWEFLETNVHLIARTYNLGCWDAEDVFVNSPVLSFVYKYYWPRNVFLPKLFSMVVQ